MSQNHRYILQPYKGIASRHNCPNCNGKHKFSRYIDTTTNEPLAEDCGRCERSDSCGYHKTPSDYFKDNPTEKPSDFQKWTPPPPPPPPVYRYVSQELFESTLGYNEKNTFHRFLSKQFGHEKGLELTDRFAIGSTKKNDTIFWRIDAQQRILTSRIFRYNAQKSDKTFFKIDCKREHNPPIRRWVHTEFDLEGYEDLPHCFFAENLIDKNKDVAIVESAKTVIIASVYLPQYSWIACETKTGLNLERLEKLLTGRNVILFPDLKALDEWKSKAEKMREFCSSVVVVDTLEEIADQSEIKSGDDAADFLLKEAPPAFTLPAAAPIKPTPETEPAPASTPLSSFEIRAKLVIEWILENGKIFNGNSEMKNKIVKNIGLVENSLDDNEALQALSILEGVKFSFCGK